MGCDVTTEIRGKWESPTAGLSVATKEQLTRQIYIRTSQTCVDGPSRRIHSLRLLREATYAMEAA